MKATHDRHLHDRNFIANPDNWPCWPFLPVKRRDNSLENGNLGVLLSTAEHKAGKMIVYLAYMFDWPQTPEGVKSIKRIEYASVDDLLADGWMVD